MEKRVKNIFKNLQKNIDLIIIKNSTEPYIDNNFFYVTGLKKGLYEGCIAVLMPDGSVNLIVSELEAESAKKSDLNVFIYKTVAEYKKILRSLVDNYKNIGINYNGISVDNYNNLIKIFPNINFYNVSKSLDKTRSIKDDLEINLIKKACRISDKVVNNIKNIVHKDMYEYELAAEIDYLMQKNGADKSAFETISSFGKNTSQPHYSHGKTKLKSGDFIVCDFGACYNKYNSDITRTFIFNKSEKKQEKIFEIVLNAQKIGLEAIKPGIKASIVHNLVKSYINRTEFKGRFIHSTGHSLGLSVHDNNLRISSKSDFTFEEGMVFTVEPGIYIPGYGGVRIEDDVLIKKEGIELLTKSSKKLESL